MTAQQKIEAATLHQAMALAFAEIEGATKDKANPAFKSKYADLGSVYDAIRPAFTKHGLFPHQVVHEAENAVCVETIIRHVSGEYLSCGTVTVPVNKRDAHGYGSALTYGRRYGLMCAANVAAEDDDGNKAAEHRPADDEPVGRSAAVNRDAPFPPGPCRNKTELKARGRELWADVLSCHDVDSLDGLLADNKELVEQLKVGLPQWWNGGTRDGETYEGLGQVIDKLRSDFDNIARNGMDFRGNVLTAG